MISNNWKGVVTDSLIKLLERWVEYYVNKMRYQCLPSESNRYIFHLSHNKKGVLIYTIEVLTGIETERCTTPHRHNPLDEFTYTFRELERMEQLAILSYIDPFDELQNKDEWKKMLKSLKCRNNADFDKLMLKAMRRLQSLAERAELVERAENKVRTWEEIALLLEVSVPTAKNIVKEGDLPITLIDGVVECDRYEMIRAAAEFKMNRIWRKGMKKM